MKLYYLPGACSLADHIALAWTGAPYEAEEVPRDQLKSPAFLAKNPAGSVPVLEDGHFVLTENIAILNYIAELHPGAHLNGDDSPQGRAEVNRWLGFLNSDVHKGFAPIFGPGKFTDDENQHEPLKAKARERLSELFGRIDQRLAASPWLAGAQRSVADAYLFVVWRWARAKQVNLGGYDHLAAFAQRMTDDPGVQQAMREEGL
ncbi:glutathione S-transferase N-terminal domain-containing protein [Oleiagrimonas sp. C23AA]|uniref:glutathione S-transferase family protein n=1 Tax=Oleiagrimonas sp. C23AA TaxID=2719047 RepID=UPI00141DAA3D|nr:glutathione S-transferase N-terminal domain-containing protein [Oleiagrimonas sp. C23AA]NII11709.1 glutathione S-transferase family protein [Oleiagrimonas sp. C23AA]